MIRSKEIIFPEDRTRGCCKILGWIVIRGERLIKLSDSWFSAKSMYVEKIYKKYEGVEWFDKDGEFCF